MKWHILREDEPDTFLDTGDVWDDGFAADGSDWGDDESNVISAKQQDLQVADPDNKSYSFSYAGV